MATLDTTQLRVGHVVVTWGMRVRLDEGGPCPNHPMDGVYRFTGTVLNMDDVREAAHVPASALRTWKWDGGWVIDREDVWVVQGNDLATWHVEDES